MKLLSLIVLSVLLMSMGWGTDLSMAKNEAKKNNKLILLSFSGSDWCIPCIKTRKEILDKEAFLKYAAVNLVLVNADFPRLKKNALSKEQTKQNEALADTYNKNGVFPLTLLLDADGKVLKQWEGYPDVSPEVFVSQITAIQHAH